MTTYSPCTTCAWAEDCTLQDKERCGINNSSNSKKEDNKNDRERNENSEKT